MRIYFLHSGTRLSNIVYDESIHIRAKSIVDDKLSIYSKKEVINAFSQMWSLNEQEIKYDFKVLDQRNSLLGLFKTGIKLRKDIEETYADLVHVTWGTYAAFMTVLFSPKPVVVSFCGSDILGGYTANGKKSFKSYLSIFLSQAAAFGAKKIIAKSSRIKAAIWNVNQNKATIIPNGVKISNFYPIQRTQAREILNWNVEEPIVLFFYHEGQTVKNKPLALATFEHIKQAIPNARLVVIQNIPHHELIHYYNGSDLLLLTSFHEGSNNSVKEAMACNLPIVSVDCGDVKDRLKGTQPSYVSKIYNETELAQACIQILKERKRSNALTFIQHISEEAIAEQLADLYQNALND